jgi:hypothetical protein
VQLHHLRSRSVEMMEKELLLATLAYNLVRAVICLACRKRGLAPRQISFTAVYNLIDIHLPRLLRAPSQRAWRREMDTLVDFAADYQLPKRKKRRSYPRAIWGSGYRFPAKQNAEN